MAHQPGRSPVKRPKPLTKDQKAEMDRVNEANNAIVNKSIDDWRAMQGLPPIDRTGDTDGK